MATEALNIIYNNNPGDGLLMEKDTSLSSATAAIENQDIVDKNPRSSAKDNMVTMAYPISFC